MKVKALAFAVILVLASSCDKTGKSSEPSSDKADQITVEKGEKLSSSGIEGKWTLSNPPKKNMSVEVTFNPDGSFRMYGRENVNDPDTRVQDLKGSWTQPNENVVYLTAPGEKEVGVMEILSLDSKSLVIHIKGEPEKEIMYFKRSN